MTTDDRRFTKDPARLKQEALQEDNTDFEGEDHNSQKRRRPWKEEGRRQDKQSKKQRLRNPEWND